MPPVGSAALKCGVRRLKSAEESMRADFLSLIDSVKRWKDPVFNKTAKVVVAVDFNARVRGLVDSIADHVTYPRGRWLLKQM